MSAIPIKELNAYSMAQIQQSLNNYYAGLMRQKGETLASIERVIVQAAVEATGGNVAQAARDLGLTRRQLAFKLEKMHRPD